MIFLIIVAVASSAALALWLNFTQSTLLIGQEIAGPEGGRHIQNAVTPPFVASLSIFIQVVLLGCVVLSFVKYGWLVGLVSGPALLFLAGILKLILPAPKSMLFRSFVLRSMQNRYADFVKGRDSVRARAMADLLMRLGHPIPSHLRLE